jgi:sugar lactone lactonase YvrE
MKGWIQRNGWLAVLLLIAFAVTAGAQTIPSIVVSSATAISRTGVSSPGKAVQDTCGNLYELEASGELVEIPADGGAVVNLVNYGSIQSGDGLLGGLAIDSSNNLYVGSKWNGAVIKVPSSNCTPNPLGATSILDNNVIGSIDGYWYDPGDIATDSSNDVFVVSDSFGGASGAIYEQTAAGVGSLAMGSTSSTPQITALAVDSSGDIFFTAGNGKVYELPVASYGTTNATAVITGLSNALGVAFDSLGNLFVGDSGTGSIYEVPFTTSLQFSKMYLVASNLTLGNPLSIAKDGKSIIYTATTSASSNVYEQVPGSANLGSVDVGSSTTGTVSVVFNASETPAAFSVSGNKFSSTGGTCAAGTYKAGQSCTITANFTPSHPGVFAGGITLTDASNNTLAAAYLSGTGLGAGITLDSGTVTSIGSGFTTPQAITVSNSGGYIADAGANAVLYFSGTSSTPVSIGTGLSKPSGVVVDGAGNVIIADTGNNRIVEVPLVNGTLTNSAQTTIVASSDTISSTKLSSPAGVSIDAQGDLFISDTGNSRIVYVPFNGSWQLSLASVLGSNLTSPLATTVDPSGNLYVADSGSGQIYELPPPFSSGVQKLVAVGFSTPSALATDASGSLFVVDQGAGTVLRIPSVSGALDPNSAIEVGFGIADPYGVAVDPTGNIYVTDGTKAAAYQVDRTTTGVNFGDWALNTASGAEPIQVENEGNQTLTFNTPFYTATGDTTEFTFGTPTDACTDGGTVAVGTNCEVDPVFQATTAGSWTDTLAIGSNAQNTSTPQVVLTGTSNPAASTTTVLAITSPSSGTPYFGEPITLKATVSATSGTPTGSAELLVDGVTAAQGTLSSGVATFSLATGLTGGSHSLQAVYQGSSSYTGSSSSPLTLSVSTAPTTSTMVITAPYSNPASVVSGGSVSFTVTINSTGVGIPTGTVTFVTGTTTLGSVSVAPASGGAFQAALATTALPVGTNTITATYSGDANYVGSVATGVVYVVSGATVGVTASSTTLTTNEGNSSSVTFTTTSYAGWTGIVGFSCLASSLPANARCVWSPGQLEVMPNSVNPTVMLKVAINQPPTTTTASKMIWWLGGLTGLALFVVRRRMPRGIWATVAMLLGVGLLGASASGVMACSSNGIANRTPAGTTTITVYASSDPFVSGSTTSVQPCINSTTKVQDASQAPCSLNTYQIAVTVEQ